MLPQGGQNIGGQPPDFPGRLMSIIESIAKEHSIELKVSAHDLC